MIKIIFLAILIFNIRLSFSQKYYVATIAFYNLENLFDCENDPDIYDEEYTPSGDKKWTEDLLNDKLYQLSNTIVNIGKDYNSEPPILIGVAEVENNFVLEELLKQKAFKNYDYGIIHKNSPDRRGIDVALLFNRNVFRISSYKKHALKLFNESLKPIHTRDQLCVSGFLAGELIHIIVNHWPSRRGGTIKSEPKRMQAAQLNLKIIDSLKREHVAPKIITMGDFNDNPNNKSFKKILNTKSKIDNNLPFYLFNPMENLYKKGIGSLAYKDKWSLFDQIIFSNSFIKNKNNGWEFKKAAVFNKDYLQTKEGKYKGYPKRTFSGSKYNSGFSDHYPVYSFLVKKASE